MYPMLFDLQRQSAVEAPLEYKSQVTKRPALANL
jgi:hypothetical protein